jgi:hypothetical protein
MARPSRRGRQDENPIAVFAGLFETSDDERIQVIEGLPRFGAKQKELAEKTSRDVADVPRYQPNTR